jgi:hypothetical protein
MKLKKIYVFNIFLMFYLFFIVSCASLATANSDTWIEREVPPSMFDNYDIIISVKLTDGSLCHVYYDKKISSDGDFYYSILMQDFGWYLYGDTWRGNQYSRRCKLGHMYINPKRQVAIYIYPKGSTFGAFGVYIEKAVNSNNSD